MMKNLFFAVALSAASLTVHAATSTQTFTFGSGLLGQTFSVNTPIAFNRFDPVLGTLTGVTWTVTGNVNYVARGIGGPAVLDPEGTEIATYRSVWWNSTSVSMRNTSLGDVASVSISPNFRSVIVELGNGATTEGYPGYQVFFQTPFSQTVNFSPGDFSQFTGTGSANLHLFTVISAFETACQFNNFGFIYNYCAPVFDYNAQRPFTSTLTYTYTPAAAPTPEKVPLPLAATVALGFALATLGRSARRRAVG